MFSDSTQGCSVHCRCHKAAMNDPPLEHENSAYDEDNNQEVATVRLRLKKPSTDKKVQWSTETVDNEHMNKKKSKCCCIYTKPRSIDEENSSSSSDSDDEECELCKGHIKKKKKKHSHENCHHGHEHSVDTGGPSINNESDASSSGHKME
ncbi:hypothetical protein HHI36_005931 [Cryptolaemus montrouzieri]|uniref:E3 ubiquitin-protein ligase PPP1R11 n=1 Tax=Cryptolaemus montrouzieri TaxID=559131 RepID=A0ABD2NVV4_9CUCU